MTSRGQSGLKLEALQQEKEYWYSGSGYLTGEPRLDVSGTLLHVIRKIGKKENKYWSLNLFQFAAFSLLLVISVWKIIKMVLNSRAYDKLVEGMKLVYGSAFRYEGKVKNQDSKIGSLVIQKASKNKQEDTAVVVIESVLETTEQIGDQTKISEAIKDLYNDAELPMVQNTFRILCGLIYLSRVIEKIIDLFTKAAEGRPKGGDASFFGLGFEMFLYLGGHCFFVIITYLLILFPIVDPKGILLSMFLVTIVNVATLSLGAILNFPILAIVETIKFLFSQPILWNCVVTVLSILAHYGVSSFEPTGTPFQPQEIVGVFAKNLLLFLVLGAANIIIYEEETKFFLEQLSSDAGWTYIIKRRLNKKILFLYKLVVYLLILGLCFYIMKI